MKGLSSLDQLTSKKQNIIGSLQENKASGPNSLPIKMLKTSKKQLSVPLTYLINLAFETGVFPDILKTAKVIPIFKKGDQQDCNNYRPISLLSNIGKIIEKLIHECLFKFLNSNNCLFTIISLVLEVIIPQTMI